MDPNDLFSLAQQAGSVPMDAATPSYAEHLNDAPPGGFSDEDILAHFVPQQAQDEQQVRQPYDAFAGQVNGTGPVVAPGSPVAPPVLPSSTSTGTKTQQKVSTSSSGYSADKNAQVARGPGGQLDQRIAGIKAEGAAKEQAQQQPYIDAAGSAGEVTVDPETGMRTVVGGSGAKGAQMGQSAAEANLITAAGHQKAIMARLQQAYDSATESTMQQEYAKANTAKAQYMAALNDFRSAQVNPHQLWDSMGNEGKVSMLAAAFVQDFLGSKGIPTSAMATFNKAVDRNIDAQIQAIQTKGKVADGFKTLWDMQMAQSHSVEEARTRMRGFMLDSMKTQIEANLSQFDAALATSKGQVAVAKMDEELAKNMAEVSKHIDTYTATNISQAIQRYGDELRASMDSQRIAVERMNAQTARDRLTMDKNAMQTDPVMPNLVYDNSKSGGGYANGVFKPGIQDAEKKAFRDAQAETNHLTDLIQEYQSLNREYGSQGPLSGTRFTKEQDARLRAIGAEILEARALKYSGKAVTDTERKILKEGTPDRVFAMTRDIASQLADTERREREALNRKREVLVFDLPPNSAYRQNRSGMGGEAKAEITEAGLIGSGEDKKKSPEQFARDGQIQDLLPEVATTPLDDEDKGGDIKAAHAQFLKAHPELAQATVYSGDGVTEPRKVSPEEAAKLKKQGYVVQDGLKPTEPLRFERGLTRIKGAAAEALEKAHEATDERERKHHLDVFNENVDVLRHYAADVTNPDDATSLFARTQLESLGVDFDGKQYREKDTGRTYSVPSDVGMPSQAVAHEEMPK